MTDSATTTRSARVRSEPHGPHWVAWIAGSDGKPVGSVIIVGQTREEAETGALTWSERMAPNFAVVSPT